MDAVTYKRIVKSTFQSILNVTLCSCSANVFGVGFIYSLEKTHYYRFYSLEKVYQYLYYSL